MEKEDSTPLSELFGSDTRGRLIFDLVRAVVADRVKITALEEILIDKGIVNREELRDLYDEVLRENTDDVINEVLQEFGRGNASF